jgi:hypothetical protein
MIIASVARERDWLQREVRQMAWVSNNDEPL